MKAFVLQHMCMCQPQVLQEVLSPLRVKTPQTTLGKALRRQLSSFDQYELDRLRHAFVRLSGGDSRVAKLTPDKIRYAIWCQQRIQCIYNVLILALMLHKLKVRCCNAVMCAQRLSLIAAMSELSSCVES